MCYRGWVGGGGGGGWCVVIWGKTVEITTWWRNLWQIWQAWPEGGFWVLGPRLSRGTGLRSRSVRISVSSPPSTDASGSQNWPRTSCCKNNKLILQLFSVINFSKKCLKIQEGRCRNKKLLHHSLWPVAKRVSPNIPTRINFEQLEDWTANKMSNWK